MADSKLTDLPEITTLSNDDVLYVADISLNASNKITYGNLINDKFNILSNSYALTADQVASNTIDIINLRDDVDTINLQTSSFSVNLSGFILSNNDRFTSSFPVDVNLDTGDILVSSLDQDLSGLQIQTAPVSSSFVRFDAINTTGSTINIGTSAVLYVKIFYT